MAKHDERTAPRDPDAPRGPREVGNLALIEIFNGRAVTHRLPARGTATVGRASDATVSLEDPQVSRLHATISLGESVTLSDLGSSNGTLVRDRRLASGETVTLHPGDVIDVGSTMLVLQAAPRVARESAPARAELDAVTPGGMRDDVVIEDPAMQRLRRLVERVAPGMINVLLLGETGVGKEIFAEMVHRRSRRAEGPFVRLNCSALAESLLESELFGHEKGAFTGATHARTGLLESACGGTLFLDEVGELPMSTQVKLLRVIEERQVTRVGGVNPRPLDVRFVSATHRDLEREIERGAFRQDLYFRLNGIALEIPPLRERVAEIDALARLFLVEACRRSEIAQPPSLSAAAVRDLRAHAWPGNLRELRNLMERAALLAVDGVITPEHLAPARRSTAPRVEAATTPSNAPAPAAAVPLREELADVEKRRILDALERCEGNQTRAAELLQMSRRTLVTRLSEYGLTRPRR